MPNNSWCKNLDKGLVPEIDRYRGLYISFSISAQHLDTILGSLTVVKHLKINDGSTLKELNNFRWSSIEFRGLEGNFGKM